MEPQMDSKNQTELRPEYERLSEKLARVNGLNLPAPAIESVDRMLSIELTHGSTAIEGNTLTLRETQLLIEEGKTPASSKELREIHEAVNHDAALKQVLDFVKNDEPITADKIREVHKLVMKNIDDENGGRYRSSRVMVTGAPKQPVRADKIEGEIDDLVGWLENSAMHRVAVAAEAHYKFVKIHPFFDGNGRTARLLMNWILVKADYPLTVIQGDDRAEYIKSFDDADREKPKDFFQFVNRCVERSLDRYLEME